MEERKKSSRPSLDSIFNERLESGHINSEGAPLKCLYCNGTNLKDEVTDKIDHIVLEYVVVCQGCGKETGHWLAGVYEII